MQLKFESSPKSSLIIYSKPDGSQMCSEEIQQTTCFSHHTSFYRWWELERAPKKGLEGRDFSVLPITGRRRLLKCRTWHFLTFLQHMLGARYLTKAIPECSWQCKLSSLSAMESTCWALQPPTVVWEVSYEGCAFCCCFGDRVYVVPNYPWRFSCLCLCNAGIKGMCYWAQIINFP